MVFDGTNQVELMGMRLEALREAELVEYVFDLVAQGRAPSILTANLDILRLYAQDPAARAVYEKSDLCIADGMPLVWASALAGTPLPERVAGSTLTTHLIAGCAHRGLSLALLGGTAGSAEKAVELAKQKYPGLAAHGDSSLRFSMPPTSEELAAVEQSLGSLRPAVILVGLGSPKQEAVIAGLRAMGSDALMVGVGGTFAFLAGDVQRAPVLAQRLGLEWLHRLSQEPRRLAHRYLAQDLPFFVTLMHHAFRRRWTGR